jgi:hypothetical protein
MRAERARRQRSQRGSTARVREACGRDSHTLLLDENQRLRSKSAELKAELALAYAQRRAVRLRSPGDPFATPSRTVSGVQKLCSYSIAVDTSPGWTSAAELRGKSKHSSVAVIFARSRPMSRRK